MREGSNNQKIVTIFQIFIFKRRFRYCLISLLLPSSRRKLKVQNLSACFISAAYDLWRPPPVPPREIDRVCSLKTNLFEFSQENNTDKASDGHVIVQHKALSLTHCSDFCLREPRCGGFNLATVPDAEVKKLCELLDEVGNIIDRPGFSFWHFDRFAYEKVNTLNFSYDL